MPQQAAPADADHPQEQAPRSIDPVLQELADLRSGSAELVRRKLVGTNRLNALLTPQLSCFSHGTRLHRTQLRALGANVTQISGQLVDALLDQESDFAIRRRIPRALAYSNDSRAVEGLMQAMDDSRFEVRFQCARALDVILQRKPEYRPAKERVFGDH